MLPTSRRRPLPQKRKRGGAALDGRRRIAVDGPLRRPLTTTPGTLRSAHGSTSQLAAAAAADRRSRLARSAVRRNGPRRPYMCAPDAWSRPPFVEAAPPSCPRREWSSTHTRMYCTPACIAGREGGREQQCNGLSGRGFPELHGVVVSHPHTSPPGWCCDPESAPYIWVFTPSFRVSSPSFANGCISPH